MRALQFMPAEDHGPPCYRSGFRHFGIVTSEKSASVDWYSQPCSVARGARWVSLTRLPVAWHSSSNSRKIAQCDEVGPIRQAFGRVVGGAPLP